jgi:hypothetical protein
VQNAVVELRLGGIEQVGARVSAFIDVEEHILWAIEVGTPVARCPPRRSRRAELPHRVPQEDAHVPDSHTACRNQAPLASRELDTLDREYSFPGVGALLALPPCPPIRHVNGSPVSDYYGRV